MSLINDALRRAKQAQQEASSPDAPEPRFRSEDYESAETSPRGLVAPLTFAVVTVIALLLAWQSIRSDHSSPGWDGPEMTLPARATESSVPASEPAPQTAPSQTPDPVVAAPVPTVRPMERPIDVQSPTRATSLVAAAPQPPRLQAVVYNPKRPS